MGSSSCFLGVGLYFVNIDFLSVIPSLSTIRLAILRTVYPDSRDYSFPGPSAVMTPV